MPKPELPYVGPRAFTKRDGAVFHGRQEEAKRLLSLAINDRTVLLYARSGAGKSSLVNAWLIPELKKLTGLNDKDETVPFEAISIRVGGELAYNELRDINLFAVNTLARLRPPDAPLPPASELRGLTLGEMLARHWQMPEVPTWLIFDQFEEIFTTPHAQESMRAQFFAQLGDVLRDPDSLLSAIFVIRDDYLARLSPYSHYLPNQFRARFYMDLLRGEAALKAIAEPVTKFGFTYAEGVAEELRDKLVSVNVGPDGDYVEPVLLQVVCQQLWEKVKEKAGEKLITTDDVAGQDDVNLALRNYYEGAVREISKGVRAREEKIRNWFSDNLIVPPGIRAQVMEEAELSGGLSTDIAKDFLNKHLLRREQVRGAFWYELAHDRLVRPVQDGNLAWFEQSGDKYQRLARRWINENKPASLLLNKQELEEFDACILREGGEPDGRVQEFVEDSRTAEKLRHAQEKAARNAELERLNAEQKELLDKAAADRFALDTQVQELAARKLSAEAENQRLEIEYKRAKRLSKFLLPIGIIVALVWLSFNGFAYYQRTELVRARREEADTATYQANEAKKEAEDAAAKARQAEEELKAAQQGLNQKQTQLTEAARRTELLNRIYNGNKLGAETTKFFAQAFAADAELRILAERQKGQTVVVALPTKKAEMGELLHILKNVRMLEVKQDVAAANAKPSDSVYYNPSALGNDLWKVQYVAYAMLRAGRKVIKIRAVVPWRYQEDIPILIGANDADDPNTPSLTVTQVKHFKGGNLIQ